MPDPITVNEQNQWAFDLSGGEGGNQERFEALAGHENLGAFVESHFASQDADWREPFVGDDMLSEEQAKRFATPADLAKSYRNSQSQLDKGFQAPALPENATDEDIAAFRETQGIPAEAKGYLENLPDGVVVGEDDMSIMEHFLGEFHAMNVQPAVAHGIIGAYNKWSEEHQELVAEADGQDFKASEDALREAWGNEYRSNVNIVGAMLQKTFGDEVADMIRNARGPDGKALLNQPEVMTGLAQMARSIDPLVTIIPNDSGGAEQTLKDEIAEIEKFMRTNRTEYNKDEGMQARLRELYEIRSKHDAAA